MSFYQFEMTGKIAGSGRVESLANSSGRSVSGYNFHSMFKNCTSLTNAPKMKSTNIYCENMFSGCVNLEDASGIKIFGVVPSAGCSNMFRECTSLIGCPEFSHSSIGNSGALNMFYGCTSLVDARSVHISDNTMDRTRDEYDQMFYGCSNLVYAPIINVTKAADSRFPAV